MDAAILAGRAGQAGVFAETSRRRGRAGGYDWCRAVDERSIRGDLLSALMAFELAHSA